MILVLEKSDDGLIYSFFNACFFLFIALFIHFTDIDYSPSSKKLKCNAGPYVYQQWLGEGFKEPWEKVKKLFYKNIVF